MRRIEISLCFEFDIDLEFISFLIQVLFDFYAFRCVFYSMNMPSSALYNRRGTRNSLPLIP